MDSESFNDHKAHTNNSGHRGVTFHNCKPDESAIVVDLGGERMTQGQLDQLCVTLNNDPIRSLLLGIYYWKD